MRSATFFVFLFVSLFACQSYSQESDYEVKTNFESAYSSLKGAIDASLSVAELDSLKFKIDSLESAFSYKKAFLDKALYPETFSETFANLRNLHARTYDRVSLIQQQGGKIDELQRNIVILTARLDSLTVERNQLFAELQDTKRSLAALRETMKKLQANLQAKDRLIFALVDSIFLQYDKNPSQLGDVQKDAISRRLLKSNVVARVYDIAADNLKFLEMTQLQPKDYAGLLDHYQQFKSKWTGLRDKISAVYDTGLQKAGQGAPGATGAKAPGRSPAVYVDSILYSWDAKLMSGFWAGLAREFTDKNVTVKPFTDAKSFSQSVRQYVDSMKAGGGDASVFVEEVWKNRIDKEWREALMKDSMLGKTEYAALDKAVSELGRSKIDIKFILYVVLVAAIAFALWRFFGRKPKPAAPTR